MKLKLTTLTILATISVAIVSCKDVIGIEATENTDILGEMTPAKASDSLDASTILYIDASGVFSDAKKSPIFNDMKSQMYQYIGTLVFIEGEHFDTTECNRQKQTLFNALENRTCTAGTNYADIQKAVEDICNGNRQGIVISDFEFWKDKKLHDQDPYLSEPFKRWLSKGYQIDILVEPYYENKNLKKRFYMFFTDPQNKSSIKNTMISQVNRYLVKNNPNVGKCCLFTLNNSDIGIQRHDSNSSNKEIDVEEKLINNMCELVLTDASWNDIKEYLMKLDNHNKVYEDETPVPILDGLKLYGGTNYSINKIKIRATNISKMYLSKQENDNKFKKESRDISDAFDVKLSPQKEVSLFLNKNIFSVNHLFSSKDGFDGNLIRIDIIADNSTINKYDETIFQWNTVIKGKPTGKTAVCVSLSVDNVLKDIDIVPDGKILYTVYLQAPSFK